MPPRTGSTPGSRRSRRSDSPSCARRSRPACRVGGYGWLENLRPATPGRAAASVPDEPGPLVTSPDDPGFIHAPSLNQASAAALLRNAHLAHGGDRNSPYAIELTSAPRSPREAAVRGRSTGPADRRAAGLHVRAQSPRRRARRPRSTTSASSRPCRERRRRPACGGSSSTGSRSATKWRADPASVLSVMPASDARRPTAQKSSTRSKSAVDAAADAVNAEGAFQMVRGNLARAAASLDAISSGQAPPPDLGFVRRHAPAPVSPTAWRWSSRRGHGEPRRLGRPHVLAARAGRPGARRMGRPAARPRDRCQRAGRGARARRRGHRHARGSSDRPRSHPDRPGLGDRGRRRRSAGDRCSAFSTQLCMRPADPCRPHPCVSTSAGLVRAESRRPGRARHPRATPARRRAADGRRRPAAARTPTRCAASTSTSSTRG